MKLEAGEVICDQCKGTGYPNNNEIDYNNKFYFNVPDACDKCHGSGKLDWIEAIVGKHKPRQLSAKFDINFSTAEQLYGPKSEEMDAVINKMSEQLAKDIDKEIIEGIANGTKTGTWGSIM